MKKQNRILWGFVITLIASGLLSACSTPKETPEQVVPKFKSAMSQVNSAELAGDLRMVGADQNGSAIDATLSFKSQFDYRDAESSKGAADLGLKGSMTLEGKKINGDIALSFRTIGDNFYLNLGKLETDHESVQKVKPLLSAYLGKWLRLPADLVPKNVRDLQKQQAQNRDAIRQLIANSSFFTVNKEYGVETVDGRKAYHYGVTMDRDGIKEYVRQASVINGRELSPAELEDSVKVLTAVTSADLWIGAKDYYLYKATAVIDGNQFADKKADMRFDLSMAGSDYNKNPSIEAPEASEEFNPLALFMGLSGVQGQGAGLPVSPALPAAPDSAQ